MLHSSQQETLCGVESLCYSTIIRIHTNVNQNVTKYSILFELPPCDFSFLFSFPLHLLPRNNFLHFNIDFLPVQCAIFPKNSCHFPTFAQENNRGCRLGCCIAVGKLLRCLLIYPNFSVCSEHLSRFCPCLLRTYLH